jgi:hypothetical protein
MEDFTLTCHLINLATFLKKDDEALWNKVQAKVPLAWWLHHP